MSYLLAFRGVLLLLVGHFSWKQHPDAFRRLCAVLLLLPLSPRSVVVVVVVVDGYDGDGDALANLGSCVCVCVCVVHRMPLLCCAVLCSLSWPREAVRATLPLLDWRIVSLLLMSLVLVNAALKRTYTRQRDNGEQAQTNGN